MAYPYETKDQVTDELVGPALWNERITDPLNFLLTELGSGPSGSAADLTARLAKEHADDGTHATEITLTVADIPVLADYLAVAGDTMEGLLNLSSWYLTGMSYQVGIGYNALVGASYKTQVGTKEHPPALPVATTTQRDALASAANGLAIYNETTNKLEFYENGGWVQFLPIGGGTMTGDIFISNNNGLVVGHAARATAGAASEVQILGTALADSSLLVGRWSADTAAAEIGFIKSRDGTIGSNTIVENGDDLGYIRWYVDDGTDFVSVAAEIRAEIDDTPGANDSPGALILAVAVDGAQVVTDRLKIGRDGDATFYSEHLDIRYADAQLRVYATSGDPSMKFEENGSDRHKWYYDVDNNYLALETWDSDGGDTDADIWRIPDGQTTIDANTTWDINVFDYVCDDCGWHNLNETDTCPDCGGTVAWQDDVALITEAMRNPKDMTLLEKLEKQGVMKRGDTPGRAWMPLQEAQKFTWSGMGQLARKLDAALARIECLETQLGAYA